MSDLVDVTIHIDELLPSSNVEQIRDILLSQSGVVAADCHEKTPHLLMVEYDPELADSGQLLASVVNQGVHAELIGL